MELRQRFVVTHPREVVWAFFGRMEDVTLCMPGASLREPPADNHAKFKLNIKLGPIGAAFVGDALVERDSESYRGIIRGNARDSRGDSRVKGVVNYALTSEGGGRSTAVDIDVDFSLTGRLAQFSRAGIVNDLAGRLTADFARNLETALNVKTDSAGTPAEGATTQAAREVAGTPPGVSKPLPEAAAAPAELNAGTLLLSVIWGRIKAFLSSIFRRRSGGTNEDDL